MRPEPRIAVVVAVFNEEGNVASVATEVVEAFDGVEAFELLFVDDGSTDATAQITAELAGSEPRIRLVRHAVRCGKSRALRTGVEAARAPWIATLDGDGQNDPRDLVAMVGIAWSRAEEAPLIAGIRTRRDDPWPRRVATRFANGLRSRALGDRCPDTACGMKVFRREDFLRLPCFEGMHRFLPALFLRYGAPVVNHPVSHRARRTGRSKYTNYGRALVGLADLFGVMWLLNRTRLPIVGRADETSTHV